MTTDQLQNELLNLAHHAEDTKKAITGFHPEGQQQYAQQQLALSGINDIITGIDRMTKMLPPGSASEIERMADEMDES